MEKWKKVRKERKERKKFSTEMPLAWNTKACRLG
jgi:hypothetical protein